MDGIYGLARVCAGFLGFTALTGVIWFGGSLSGIEFAAGLILGLTSLLAAFIPKRRLSVPSIRQMLIMLCALGIAAGAVLTVRKLAGPNQIEWDVVAIDLLNLIALAVMAIKARRHVPED